MLFLFSIRLIRKWWEQKWNFISNPTNTEIGKQNNNFCRGFWWSSLLNNNNKRWKWLLLLLLFQKSVLQNCFMCCWGTKVNINKNKHIFEKANTDPILSGLPTFFQKKIWTFNCGPCFCNATPKSQLPYNSKL